MSRQQAHWCADPPTFFLILSGVSVTKIADESTLDDIFVLLPCNATGEKREPRVNQDVPISSLWKNDAHLQCWKELGVDK